MKKQLLIVGLATLSFSAGAFALAGVQKISADLRPDIKLVQNGKYEILTDAKGNTLYPLSYNGSTYLPIRSVARLTGQEVNWNSATNTITLTSNNSSTAKLPDATQTNTSHDSTLTALEAKVNSITTEVSNWTPSSNKTAEYNTLDTKIESIDYELEIFDNQLEFDYDSGKLDANTYLVLDKKLNLIDNKLDSAENMLESKFYTQANKPATQPTPNTGNNVANKPSTSTNANITKFQSRATALINEVKALKPAASYQARLSQYRSLDAKIDLLDREMDQYEDSIERDYRAGRLSYDAFIKLDRQIEAIENSIDNLDDILENKLGIDD